MIPTIDNYFCNRFKKILSAILSSVDDEDTEHYLIDEALHGYSPSAISKFKKAYAIKDNKSALPIDVLFSYPDGTKQSKGCYVITRGGTSEDSALGSIGGSINSGESGRQSAGENIANEVGTLKKDSTGYYIDTENPILEMISIKEMDNSNLDRDNLEIGSKKFRLTSDILQDIYLGENFTISYLIQDTGSHKDYANKIMGYVVKEDLVISALSDNADTTRELDTLLKFILIYMRYDPSESNYYQIPEIKSEPLGTVDYEKGVEGSIYIINTTLTYTTTYSVSKDSATRISDILVNLKSDNRRDEDNG